jgi:starch phosphorylase
MAHFAIQAPSVAYFSMEVGADESMPTYSGGLGLLAGDMLRAAADQGLPFVGVTLLPRKGYFRQHLDGEGNQTEGPAVWTPEEKLERLPNRISLVIEGRPVQVGAWKFRVRGVAGAEVPLYFLDTDVAGNSDWDRTLTDFLYGGDDHYRLCQEAVLGLGGVAMLESLGHSDVSVYHMNEGHSALLALALLEKEARRSACSPLDKEVVDQVRESCVFTTHTPVPAGMDKFPLDLVRRVLGPDAAGILSGLGVLRDGVLNMTLLALSFSHYVNGVSLRNEEISHDMFPNYPIRSVTNGVHAVTWTSPPFAALFDRHIPPWRNDNLYLRYAVSLPLDEIREAHTKAKLALLDEVRRRTGVGLDPARMTIGFARRMATYKRADLLFFDLGRLKSIARTAGPVQILYGGKAHPRDEGGKEMIRRVFRAAQDLRGSVPVVFLEEYDMTLAKLLCAGADLWLNTPHRPFEASGTSGMKAALNGVPSLSILDGWWVEGHVEGVTGWSIGDLGPDSNPLADALSLYDKLEKVILPMFYRRPADYGLIGRWCIALNASFYNTQRMVIQYLENAYMLPG